MTTGTVNCQSKINPLLFTEASDFSPGRCHNTKQTLYRAEKIKCVTAIDNLLIGVTKSKLQYCQDKCKSVCIYNIDDLFCSNFSSTSRIQTHSSYYTDELTLLENYNIAILEHSYWGLGREHQSGDYISIYNIRTLEKIGVLEVECIKNYCNIKKSKNILQIVSLGNNYIGILINNKIVIVDISKSSSMENLIKDIPTEEISTHENQVEEKSTKNKFIGYKFIGQIIQIIELDKNEYIPKQDRRNGDLKKISMISLKNGKIVIPIKSRIIVYE